MASDDARERLLDLIDKQAFEPVLGASPKDYQSEGDRQKLADAQQTTRSTQHRYHTSYKTAKDVYQNYKDDLSSNAAEDVDRELKALHLPTLGDIKPKVEKLAEELGVK